MGLHGLCGSSIPSCLCASAWVHVACSHWPKPILVNTGKIGLFEVPWQPNILPFQLVKIGRLVIGAAPSELTTMVGRRIKQKFR